MGRQQLAILGVTGSIGRQALKVVDNLPELFSVDAMSAGSDWETLAMLAKQYKPSRVAIADVKSYADLKNALSGYDIEVTAGGKAIEELPTGENIDCVLAAIVGYAGLSPTLNAICHGKKIALANKETLVVAGEIVMEKAKEHGVDIIPVDSEHSAIFQSLCGEVSSIDKIILTASGGPFLGFDSKQLNKVTVEDALKHPKWVMGRKITIDSATLMNKGLEVIEAAWLFNLKPEQIEVMVHPQSIVHSMVQFADGAIKAQLGTPDMMIPIQYALTYPKRESIIGERVNFMNKSLQFIQPDTNLFPCLRIAYDALKNRGNMPCVMNGANEEAVGAFLRGDISFIKIPDLIEKTIERVSYVKHPTMADYMQSDSEARRIINELIKK